MVGKCAVLLVLATVNLGSALSIKKATEGGFDTFCIFGICFSDKKDYEKSVKVHDHMGDTEAELQKRSEEMDAWKKEDDERKQLELEEQRAKAQEQKDSIIAQQCQCTWECGDRNDGTVCFRKCCNNEFGGNPNGPVTPKTDAPSLSLPGLSPAPAPAAAASPGAPSASNPLDIKLPEIIANMPNPLANLPNPFAAAAKPAR